MASWAVKEPDLHDVFQSRGEGELEANNTAGVHQIEKTVKPLPSGECRLHVFRTYACSPLKHAWVTLASYLCFKDIFNNFKEVHSDTKLPTNKPKKTLEISTRVTKITWQEIEKEHVEAQIHWEKDSHRYSRYIKREIIRRVGKRYGNRVDVYKWTATKSSKEEYVA